MVEALELDDKYIWRVVDLLVSVLHPRIVSALVALVAFDNLIHVFGQVHGEITIGDSGLDGDRERASCMLLGLADVSTFGARNGRAKHKTMKGFKEVKDSESQG